MPAHSPLHSIYRMHRSNARSSLSSLKFLVLGLALGFGATLCLHSLGAGQAPPTCRPRPSRLQAPGLRDGDGGLLLLGIMTAQKYVDSRAWAIWKTWAPLVPGKLVFFVAEGTVSAHPELPLVHLPGTDDAYPPQKKSFSMLKWMAREGLGRFQWFMRADDDVYIRTDRLELLLRSLNASRPLLLGQAGLGTAEEYGTLSLGSEDNYCMGGPGILFSAATLRTIAPHLPFCLRNMYTTHEDVEVGRCVRKFVGISCSWSYEMQSIFYNNQSGLAAYSGDLNVGEVAGAMTLHPLKRPLLMRRLHGHLRGLKTGDLRYRSLQLSRDVLRAAQAQLQLGRDVHPDTYEHLTELGKDPSLRRWSAASASSALPWDFLSPNVLFCGGGVNCPRHNADSYLKYALKDLTRQLIDSLNKNQRALSRQMIYQDTLYGYRRVDPLHGADYILDVLLLYKKFKGRRVTVPVRRHTYITQSFGPLQLIGDADWRRIAADALPPTSIVEEEARLAEGVAPTHAAALASPDDVPLTVVVPLAGRSAAFARFLAHFESVVVDGTDAGDTRLLVVLFRSQDSEEDGAVLAGLRRLASRATAGAVRWIELEPQGFSRGLALAKGAASLSTDSLMFFTDADVLFSAAALGRIRRNTQPGRRAYFPIVFSEFAPATWDAKPIAEPFLPHFHEIVIFGASESGWDLGNRRGFFRHFGFGIVGLFRSDLEAVGGMETRIQGWGLEDVNLFEKVLKSERGLEVFRAPDPGLVHVYHDVSCDKSLPLAQYEMCLNSFVSNYASVEALAELAARAA